MLFISLKVLEYPFKQNKNMLKKHESAVMYVLKKRRFENMKQIYRRTPMSKCDFK